MLESCVPCSKFAIVQYGSAITKKIKRKCKAFCLWIMGNGCIFLARNNRDKRDNRDSDRHETGLMGQCQTYEIEDNEAYENYSDMPLRCIVCLYDVPKCKQGSIRIGCSNNHWICGIECANMAISSMLQTSDTSGLLCGCIDLYSNQYVLMNFANRVEHRLVKTNKKNDILKWLETQNHDMTLKLLKPCHEPSCPSSAWPLSSDICPGEVWTCGKNHKNIPLVALHDIIAVNKELEAARSLQTSTTEIDRCKILPRYRLCPQCIGDNLLIMCEHDGGCKMYPGCATARKQSGTICKHTFCFSCCKPWNECGHNTICPVAGRQILSMGDRNRVIVSHYVENDN